MKHIYLYLILFASLVFSSCEKDETKLESLPSAEVNAPELTLEGSSNYIAEESTLNIYPNVLNWTKSNFGNPSILGTYVLQIDTTPNFTSRIEKTIGNNIYSYALSGKELSGWGTNFNKSTDNLKEVTLFFRIAASIYVNNPTSIIVKPDTVFSQSVNIAVTPILLETPVIYVPGNQQGWNPASATKLYSSGRDNIYTGYVYLDGEFKFTTAPNWDEVSYGLGSSDGTLSSSGGNITATKGYYWASVNIPSLTYSITSVEWSVIGSALNGWDSDVPLLFNTSTNKLSLTVAMNAGEFKFRRDKSWDTSLGLSDKAGVLTPQNGSNITVEGDGTYTITLDLSDPENFTYTLTKQ